MLLSGNTILITGAGSGIGRRLAVAFLELGNEIIAADKDEKPLKELTAKYPQIKTTIMDVNDSMAIHALGARASADYPKLNVLINNAGIQKEEDLVVTKDSGAAETMIGINLLAPIRLVTALLPHLRTQQNAVILNVSSMLGFVPLAVFPTYCATKAAVHSYTVSLRYQLKQTGIQVLELIPPYVQTNLSARSSTDSKAMPAEDFISEVMSLLKKNPDAKEIVVQRAERLRYATENRKFDKVFESYNLESAHK